MCVCVRGPCGGDGGATRRSSQAMLQGEEGTGGPCPPTASASPPPRCPGLRSRRRCCCRCCWARPRHWTRDPAGAPPAAPCGIAGVGRKCHMCMRGRQWQPSPGMARTANRQRATHGACIPCHGEQQLRWAAARGCRLTGQGDAGAWRCMHLHARSPSNAEHEGRASCSRRPRQQRMLQGWPHCERAAL